MNEVIRALMERRSIRRFSPGPVAEKDLETILAAGLYAPSARNTQPWRITALTTREAIAELEAALKTASVKPGFDYYARLTSQEEYTINFVHAPVFIIVTVDREQSFAPEADGALVLGNIFLAAHALGYGTCWINQLGPVGDEPGFRRVLTGFGVPEAHRVIGCAALGCRAGDNPAAPERKPGIISIVR